MISLAMFLQLTGTAYSTPAEEIGDHGNLLEWDKSTYKNALTEHPSGFVHEPQRLRNLIIWLDLCAVHGAANCSTNAPDKEVMCDLRCSAMLEIHVGCHGTGVMVR